MRGDLEALIALLLLGASLPSMVASYASAARWLRGEGAERERGEREAGLVALATLIGGVVRAVVPHGIATIYIGYLLTEQAIELSPASHYGLGSQALYHALFAFLPHDHRTLMAVNAVIGTLTLPLAAAVCGRLLGDRRASVAYAALAALTPLFVRNDGSDANNVPVLFWLMGGLVSLGEFLERGERPRLLSASCLLTLAAIGRPEMPLLVPLVVALCAWAWPGRRPLARLARDRALWACLGVCFLLVLPHASHIAEATDVLSERGSLPGTERGSIASYLTVLATKNTLITPRLFPIALPALALVGLASRRRWQPRLALALLSGLCLLPYLLDICRANMARVHVPAAVWVTMLAAGGLTALASVPRWGKALCSLAALAFVLSAWPTARALWAPTNEQAEETFARRSLAALPAGNITLVRFDRADRVRSSPGSASTHHHFPDYLVRPPVREGRVASIRDFVDEPDLTSPAFFYHGTRCYAEFRTEGTPPPHGEALQPACAEMHRRFLMEPVITWDAPNRGDVWLEYYGDAPVLRLGLYRVVGLRP